MEYISLSSSPGSDFKIQHPDEQKIRSKTTRNLNDVQPFFESSPWNTKADFWIGTYVQLVTSPHKQSLWRATDECRLRSLMFQSRSAGNPLPPPIANQELVDRFSYLDPHGFYLPFLFGSGPPDIWNREVSQWPDGEPIPAFKAMLEHLAGSTKTLKVPSCMIVSQIRTLIEVAELAERVQNDYFSRECGQKLSILLDQMGDDFIPNIPIDPNCIRDFFHACPDLLERLLALNPPQCTNQLLLMRDPIDTNAVLSALRDAMGCNEAQEKEMDVQISELGMCQSIYSKLKVTPLISLLYVIDRYDGKHPGVVKGLTELVMNDLQNCIKSPAAVCLLRLAAINPLVKEVVDQYRQQLTQNVSCSALWGYRTGDEFKTHKLTDESAQQLADLLERPWMTSLRNPTAETFLERLNLIKQQSKHIQMEMCRTLPYIITPENLPVLIGVLKKHRITLPFHLRTMFPDVGLARWPGLTYEARSNKYCVSPEMKVDDHLWEFLAFTNDTVLIPNADHVRSMGLWSRDNDRYLVVNYLKGLLSDYSEFTISVAYNGAPELTLRIDRIPIQGISEELTILFNAAQNMVLLGWTFICRNEVTEEYAG
ncbi:MAG: hypothetical protein Q8K75_07785 [Chlamydiales bacterium]|nr:hypothetical protein [Chlamydiales bacterium]